MNFIPRSFIPRSLRHISHSYYNENEIFYNGDFNDFQSENYLNSQNNSSISSSLEYLISTPQITNSSSDNQEVDLNELTLIDFKRRNLNNLKEDLLYYFSSPETILHFKSIVEEENIYDFFKDLDCENFLDAQKERIKKILSVYNSDLDSQMKISKLSNYNNSFCAKASLIQDNEKINEKLINANLLGIKMDECSELCTKQEIDENRLIAFLYELKDIFQIRSIDMESLGLIHFNYIEKNLIFILKIIENKFIEKKNKQNLITLVFIFVDILKSFHSTKLYFYIIKFLKQHQEILDSTKLEPNKEIIQFIPNNCFNFILLNKNVRKLLINDLRISLSSKGIINKAPNQISLNLYDYRTLNYDDYLLLFINPLDNLNEKNIENYFFYYKIDLINKNIIDIGKINLLNEEEEKNKNLSIIDINISIKNELIYIFFILENSPNYSLKYKLYNKY